MHDALVSEADELRAQLKRYEQLRDGAITGRELDSLRELPTALIEARIAANLTQRASPTTSASLSNRSNAGRQPPTPASASTASKTSPTPSAAASARTSPTAAAQCEDRDLSP
jgi:hypothetical protein